MIHPNTKHLASISAFTVLLLPLVVVHAEEQVPLIPCNGVDCDFQDLITMANRIIGFLLYKVCVPLAGLGFMYAGARLILAQHKESAWSEAQESFTNIGKGFIIIMASFIVVKLVLSAFLSESYETFVKTFLE